MCLYGSVSIRELLAGAGALSMQRFSGLGLQLTLSKVFLFCIIARHSFFFAAILFTSLIRIGLQSLLSHRNGGSVLLCFASGNCYFVNFMCAGRPGYLDRSSHFSIYVQGALNETISIIGIVWQHISGRMRQQRWHIFVLLCIPGKGGDSNGNLQSHLRARNCGIV
jgi:hypothetical protein